MGAVAYRFLALLLVLMGTGALVMALLGLAQLPGWPSPVGGLGFLAAGLGLLAGGSGWEVLRLATRALGMGLLALAGWTLAHVAGLLNTVFWPPPTNIYSATGFIFAGLYLLQVPGQAVMVPQGLALAVLALGWVTLLGSLGDPDLLVRGLFRQSDMPLGASLGLVALGGAMLLRGFASPSWRNYYRDRQDRLIAGMATQVLLIVALTVGVGGAGLTARAALSVYNEAMMSRAMNDAQSVRDAVARVHSATWRAVDGWGPVHESERAATLLARLRRQLGEGSINHVRLQQGDGHIDAAGDAAALLAPALEVVAGECRLSWHEDPGLICTREVRLASGGRGRLTVVAPLQAWVPDAFGSRVFGASGETLYCARLSGGDRCLKTRFVERPFVPPERIGKIEIPMSHALNGMTGVISAPDYRGVLVKAVYVSVLPGLGLVQKVDLEELMAPASNWLQASLLLIFLLTLVGGWGLYRALVPMTWALRQRQRRQRAILQHAPMAMLTANEDGAVEQLNQQAARLLGVSERNIRGKPLIEFFDDPELVILLRDPMLRGGSIKTRSYIRRADGNVEPVDVWLTMESYDNARYWILVLNDRREQLAREGALESWETAFVHARSGMVLGHPDGVTILDVNPAFAQMHGYEREELVGSAIVDLFAPSERASLADHIRKAHAEGRHAFESVHVRKDGAEFPVLVDVSTVYHADGTPRLRVVNVEDLTATNELQARLKESEHMQRLVLDSQQEMLVRWRPDSTIVYANRAYGDLFGRHPEDLVGQRWLDLLDERAEDQDSLRQMVSLVAEMVRRPRRMEHVIGARHVTSGKLWIHWTLLPLYGADGRLEAVQASGRDVTARKAMEDSLRESESWFRAVFNSSFQYAVVLDCEGRVRAANEASLDYTGLRLDQIVGVPVWELEGPSRNVELQDRLRDAVAQASKGTATQFEAEGTDRHGYKRTLDLSVRAVQDGGVAIAGVIVEAHDVTAYRSQQKKLQQREARFQAIAQSTQGIAIEFRREGERVRILYVHQSPTDICACSGPETELDDFLQCLHPDGRGDFLATLRQCEQDMREFAWVGQLSSGRDAWLSFRAVPRNEDDGVVWTGVGLDVTDVKQKEDEIELSRADLRELTAHHELVREDERKTMAREIHDELGQNLTALRMGLAVLGERTHDDAGLEAEVSRLKRLVDTSITVVRGVAMTLRPAALDLGLAAALRWLASEAELNTRLSVSVDCDLSAGDCPDDMATAMFRIAQESLTNVARHAGASHVSIHVHRINRHVVMEITDDGRGFDVDGRDGSGFGLKSMKERAIAFGGELRLRSKPGEGTHVAVWIPQG